MADDKAWSVDGYKFSTQKDVKLAQKEVEKIAIIEQKLDYKNIQMVKLVYDKTLESRVFKTPIGFDFLKKLQNLLIEKLPQEEIEPIPINQIFELRDSSNTVEQRIDVSKKKTKIKPQVDKQKYTKSVFLNVALVALVLLLFFITTTSSNPNVLNYERALQNKYASWEEELSQREEAIRVKEKELLLKED